MSETATLTGLIAEHARLSAVWRNVREAEGDDTPNEDAAFYASRDVLHAIVTFPCRTPEAGAVKARHLLLPPFIELVEEDDVKALLQSMIVAGEARV